MMAYSHGPMVTLRRLEWEATMGHDGNRALEIPWKLRCNGKSFGNHQSWMETLETWRSYRGNTGKHTLGTSWEKFFFFGGVYKGKSTGKTYPSQLSPAFAFPPHQRQAVPSCAKLHIVEWCAEAKLGGSLRQSEVRMDSSQHCELKKSGPGITNQKPGNLDFISK